MASMGAIAAIGHNLRHLLSFRGRETRERFWPYAILIFLVTFAVAGAAMLPEMAAAMERTQRFAIEHPEQATVERSPGSYSITIEGYHPELMPDIGGFMMSMAWMLVAVVLLLAAAVARRLHDRGKSGAWGLLPLPFLTFGLVGMTMLLPPLFRLEQPNLASFLPLFFTLFLNNVLYLASLVFLIVLLCGRSQGANRYGPPT